MAMLDQRVSYVLRYQDPCFASGAFLVNSEEVISIPNEDDQVMVGRQGEDGGEKLVSFDTLPGVQGCG